MKIINLVNKLLATYILLGIQITIFYCEAVLSDEYLPHYLKPTNPYFAEEENNTSLIEIINNGKYSRNYLKYNNLCFVISDYNYLDSMGFLCMAGWIGDEYDLWAFYENAKEHKWTEPFYTGFSINEIIRVNEELLSNSFLTEFLICDINLHISNAILELTISYAKRITDERGYRINDMRVLCAEPTIIDIPIDMLFLEDDTDDDRLTDLLEKRIGTSHFQKDTDGDGIDDAFDSSPQSSYLNNNSYCEMVNKIFMKEVFNRDLKNVYLVNYGIDDCSIRDFERLVLNTEVEHYLDAASIVFKLVESGQKKYIIETYFNYGVKDGIKKRYEIAYRDNEWIFSNEKILYIE